MTAQQIQVTSKTSAVLLGTWVAPVSIINNSATDTVWLGSDSSLGQSNGIPLQAQSQTQWGSGTGPVDVYAILDSAASNPVTVIAGGDISGWQPSPVKVVNISGPVAITGTVSISGTVNVAGSVSISGGSVNIGTITGTVTITGPVTVTNTPGVIPLSNLTTLLNNVSAGTVQINDVSPYNTLCIAMSSNNSHLATSAYVGLSYALYSDLNLGGIQIDNSNIWAQGCFFDGATDALAGGNLTFIVLPLNGAKSIGLQGNIFGTANGGVTISVYGTNAVLPYSVKSRNIYPPNRLMWASHLLAGSGSSFPIPCWSKPVRIYFHLDSSAAASSVIVRLTDTVSGVQIGSWTVPRSFNAGNGTIYNGSANIAEPNPYTQYIDLPDSLAPLAISTGSVTTPSNAEIMVTGAV